jgi:hypothetical protein
MNRLEAKVAVIMGGTSGRGQVARYSALPRARCGAGERTHPSGCNGVADGDGG